MNLFFANPAGFWALLGVPAVVLIHFLQRESRRVVTSTLFLLEAVRPVSAQGRRFERLRSSLPLWLQIAAVLLLTWLLAGPRRLRPDSSQRVVVVLDSSVSMLASRADLVRALEAKLRALDRTAARTDWRLLESDPARPTLYAGPDLALLVAALGGWQPHLGTHDFRPALEGARTLARDGVALFATDRLPSAGLPEGVECLAAGRPVDNVGWIGVRVEPDGQWRALVRNHAATAQTRAWHLQAGAAAAPDATLTLAPGQTLTLGGTFPPGADRCELVLGADAFSPDDRLPIVRPQAKPLALAVRTDGTPLESFGRRLAESLPDTKLGTAHGDAALEVWTPGPHEGHAVRFAPPAPDRAEYLDGDVVAENDPLTAGLSWNGLLAKAVDPVPAADGDETLLWQRGRPLVFLRGGRADRSLVVNFDVRQSNADRLPAFVVLLHRFLESVRAETVAFEQVNAETNQSLAPAADPALPPPRMAGGAPDQRTDNGPLRAPALPGFFEVTQNGRPLLAGAAHFADAREADFRDASALDTLQGKRSNVVAARNREEDVAWPLYALLLLAACLANWALTSGSGQATQLPVVSR